MNTEVFITCAVTGAGATSDRSERVPVTPEQIATAALQEDADAIGLSILSGAHNHIAPKLMSLLAEKGLDDVLVVIGGIIPDVDVPKLKAIGIKGVFLPGTPMLEIIDFINANARARV